jgi:hypothetical protein
MRGLGGPNTSSRKASDAPEETVQPEGTPDCLGANREVVEARTIAPVNSGLHLLREINEVYRNDHKLAGSFGPQLARRKGSL